MKSKSHYAAQGKKQVVLSSRHGIYRNYSGNSPFGYAYDYFYIVLGNMSISPILVAIIAFSTDFSSYVWEMMRNAINTVDKSWLEAATAIGFNKPQTYWRITIPQAARYVLPVYKGGACGDA